MIARINEQTHRRHHEHSVMPKAGSRHDGVIAKRESEDGYNRIFCGVDDYGIVGEFLKVIKDLTEVRRTRPERTMSGVVRGMVLSRPLRSCDTVTV